MDFGRHFPPRAVAPVLGAAVVRFPRPDYTEKTLQGMIECTEAPRLPGGAPPARPRADPSPLSHGVALAHTTLSTPRHIHTGHCSRVSCSVRMHVLVRHTLDWASHEKGTAIFTKCLTSDRNSLNVTANWASFVERVCARLSSAHAHDHEPNLAHYTAVPSVLYRCWLRRVRSSRTVSGSATGISVP